VNHVLRIPLNVLPAQLERLRALQVAFAEACNAIAPVVQSTRCWNRVALHHLVYRTMRERFPALGSQMICNAVYSVSRTARMVLQSPNSPWNVNKRSDAPLPLMRFAPSAPVFFDRHTLSLRNDVLSMFTLDGRMRFDLRISAADKARFRDERLLEVMLVEGADGLGLTFRFAGPEVAGKVAEMAASGLLPEYIVVVPPEPMDSLPAGSPPSHDASNKAAATNVI
jgi:hypothetical protein